MEFGPKIHGRRSIRLQGYDYSQAGAYFVTIVAWRREMLFGEIVDGKTPQGGHLVLNDFGRIVCEEWERTAAVRPRVELGAFVVMPNHIHGILVFTDNVMNDVNVGATRRVAPTRPTLRSGSLGAVIGQFKSLVTKRINRLRTWRDAPSGSGIMEPALSLPKGTHHPQRTRNGPHHPLHRIQSDPLGGGRGESRPNQCVGARRRLAPTWMSHPGDSAV